MGRTVLALAGLMLLSDVGTARSDECYGSGSRSLAEVGDYRTYRDQNGILTTSTVTSASYDPVLDVQEITTQAVGGSSDGRLSYYRNSLHQGLFEGFDRTAVFPNVGLVTISTRYVPPIPTSFPICPDDTQAFSGGILITAPGYTPCTGAYSSNRTAQGWELVSIAIGNFSALRVDEELHLTFDCGLPPDNELSAVWLAPGAGSVRIESGSTVRELVDAKPAPVPEPASILMHAASVIAMLLASRRRRR